MEIDELIKKKVGFVSLGCDKNRVDLEEIIARIGQTGFEITNDPAEANIIIVNTCAFLEASRRESIDTILQMAAYKELSLEKLIVTGCLTNYKIEEVDNQLPEVDLFVPIEKNKFIVDEICKLYGVKYSDESPYNRMLTTPSHYAYLKIADGCNNFCSYCTIPYIRGRFTSVPMEDLINQAEALVANGVTEIILVAQDVTKYGKDMYGEHRLVPLIQELSKIKKLKQIRLLYCYPELINEELINEIAKNKKVCKYIDMPLQHISDDILRAMHRRNGKEAICNLITHMREKIPNLAIRTTFIVGFPGEKKKHFRELLDFIKEYKLTHVGFFAYSREKGTPASLLPNQVPNFIKKHRVNVAGKLQYSVVTENNNSMIGKTLNCVVDSIDGDYAVLRSEYQCPIVDSNIYVADNTLKVGKYYQVKITNVLNYDLEGEINHELTK